MNDPIFRPKSRLTGTMTPEERVRVVVALDHDGRQPQTTLAMSLRNLRILINDLDAAGTVRSLQTTLPSVKAELVAVQAAVRQITDLQQDLIDAIRLELDDTRPTPRSINADEIIERACKSNMTLAKDLDISLRGAQSRMAFIADERWVDRILNNLIANAIWHSNGKNILIGARPAGDDIAFEVRDNGRGIKPEAVARIFEPIEAPSLTPIGYSAARSGLGLYNVRLYTERMGGTVTCVSEPRRGTLFRVRLPGPVTRVAPRPRLRDMETARLAKNKLVAILDDDVSLLRTTERLFGSLGVEVFAHHEPMAWLNGVVEMKRMPDLVLLDYQLKNSDCTTYLDVIRRRWGGDGLKVIVVTGHARNPNLLKISEQVPVLRKPLTEATFGLILDVLAERRQLPEAGFL
ncbi:MAG: ATP-binding protein [Burkholderiaceae bacterium]